MEPCRLHKLINPDLKQPNRNKPEPRIVSFISHNKTQRSLKNKHVALYLTLHAAMLFTIHHYMSKSTPKFYLLSCLSYFISK